MAALKKLKAYKRDKGPDGTPDAEMVLLMADRRTDAAVITSVLRSAGTAGYVNVKFGVIAR